MDSRLSNSINRLLNICDHEWPRVTLGWLLSFFFKASVIIGWTVLVATFVSHLGIENLPKLFIAHAILIIFGTLIFSQVVHLCSQETLMIITSILSAIVLLLASFFAADNSILFFSLLLIGGSLLLSQLGILIYIFHEELFSPAESERTFPIMESAETFGALTAGIIINRLANSIPTFSFIYIWILLVLLTIPVIFFYQKKKKKFPQLQPQKKAPAAIQLKGISQSLRSIQKNSFLKGLMTVVILQWLFLNLFEFQYTKAISNSINAVISLNNYEQKLTYDLGSLHIVFSSFALIVQLFIASRVNKSLGTIGSMMVNPLVMILGVVSMFYRFNIFTAVVAKTCYEISNAISKNPYHTSFYALGPKIRKKAKEFLEGLAKPLGALLGTIIIIIFQQIYLEHNLIFAINITLVAISIIILSQLCFLQTKYTELSTENLKNSPNQENRFYALEILSQNGHRGTEKNLSEVLLDEDEDTEIKIKALETLGILQNVDSLPEILQMLEHQNVRIRKSALECLKNFEDLDIYANNNTFARYRITSTLKELFEKETDDDNRSVIINILAGFNNTEAVDFIVGKLRTAESIQIKKSCISACGSFEDPNCGYYILPYLKSSDLKLRIIAISTLWKFPVYHERLGSEIEKLLNQKNIREMPEVVCELAGNLKLKKYKKNLKQWTKSTNHRLKVQAAVALTKMEEEDFYPMVARALLETDCRGYIEIQNDISSLEQKEKKKFEKILHHEATEYISKILHKSGKSSYEALEITSLKKLNFAYKIARNYDAYHETGKILKKHNELNGNQK